MLSREDEQLNTIYIVSVTRQTMPNTPEPLFNCDEVILLARHLQYKLDWIWDNQDDLSEYSKQDAIDSYVENFDGDEEPEIDFEELFNLANDKKDLAAITALFNGDVNQLNTYSVTTVLNFILG